MSYELAPLALERLDVRIDGSHRYVLTTYGRRVAYLMTKLQNRIFSNVASAAFQTFGGAALAPHARFTAVGCRTGSTCRSANLGPA